jgi:hypothetical protein
MKTLINFMVTPELRDEFLAFARAEGTSGTALLRAFMLRTVRAARKNRAEIVAVPPSQPKSASPAPVRRSRSAR